MAIMHLCDFEPKDLRVGSSELTRVLDEVIAFLVQSEGTYKILRHKGVVDLLNRAGAVALAADIYISTWNCSSFGSSPNFHGASGTGLFLSPP